MVTAVSAVPKSLPCLRDTFSKKRRRNQDNILETQVGMNVTSKKLLTGNDDSVIKVEKVNDEVAASNELRRHLMGLALQLKLKMCIVEAWASDWNTKVMSKNLHTVANELASLHAMGLYEERVCLQFLDIVKRRMTTLLEDCVQESKGMIVDVATMWSVARAQICNISKISGHEKNSKLHLLVGYDSSIHDTAVVWKAMMMARDRGAQLWQDNKHEQALPFLAAADSYMKRFTIKYERLMIDHAMVDMLRVPHNSPKKVSTRSVRFANDHIIIGNADPLVDRSPICPSRPSRVESLLLRTSRNFPSPAF